MIITMKYLFFLILTISIYAQSARPVTVKTFDTPPNETKVEPKKEKEKPKEAEPKEASSLDDDELDKLFYTYYYLNLPKHLQKEDKDKKKLHTNLIGVTKKEIQKRDRSVSKEDIDNISPSTVKFKRVTDESKWMKKIKAEMKYINFTEYMYIVRYKQYLVLIIFHLDPELHLQSPAQVEFLNVQKTEPMQDLE